MTKDKERAPVRAEEKKESAADTKGTVAFVGTVTTIAEPGKESISQTEEFRVKRESSPVLTKGAALAELKERIAKKKAVHDGYKQYSIVVVCSEPELCVNVAPVSEKGSTVGWAFEKAIAGLAKRPAAS